MPHIHSWPGAVYSAKEVRFFVPLLQLGARFLLGSRGRRITNQLTEAIGCCSL